MNLINYYYLMNFGISSITSELESKYSHLLSAGFITHHRGLETLQIDEPFYVYSGRGPSSASFHLGHLPGLLTIRSILVHSQSSLFMIADDEKILRDNIDINEMRSNVVSTIKQLDKFGINENVCDILINSAGINKEHYEILLQLMNHVTLNQLINTFGEKQNIGEYFYALRQLVPCFIKRSERCVVIAGLDQDPFFRLARDLARKLEHPLPIILYTTSVPGIDGSDKMSTNNLSSIKIDETSKSLHKKVFAIKKVGAGTLDELFEKGAELSIDIPYQLLHIFHDKNLDIIRKLYTTGINEADLEDHETKFLHTLESKDTITRNNKTMITSYGIRNYLYRFLCSMLKFSQ